MQRHSLHIQTQSTDIVQAYDVGKKSVVLWDTSSTCLHYAFGYFEPFPRYDFVPKYVKHVRNFTCVSAFLYTFITDVSQTKWLKI